MRTVQIYENGEQIDEYETSYDGFVKGGFIEVWNQCYKIKEVCYCFSKDIIQLTIEEY